MSDTKRYWVKLTLEVREYDEGRQRVLQSGILSDFGTQLTPEPDKYVEGFLKERAEKLTKALMDEENEPKQL